VGHKGNVHKGKTINSSTMCSPGLAKKGGATGGIGPSGCVGCVGCGTIIQNDTRALQCDKCNADKWKCIECLGMTGDVYHGLIDAKICCGSARGAAQIHRM